MRKLALLTVALVAWTMSVLAVPTKYVAHRGDYPDVPEGSMAAYRNAVARGSEIVKLDVHPSKDGVIVMSHDPSFKRTMGWNVKIADVTWDEIRRHRYLFKGQPTDERAVTLPEVLAVVRGVPEFWIDFKHFDPDFCERVLAEFAKAGIAEERVMLATYTQEALKYMRTAHPNVRRIGHIDFHGKGDKWSPSYARHKGVLYAGAAPGEPYAKEVAEGILGYAQEMGLWGLNLDSNPQVITKGLVDCFKSNGYWVSIALIHDAARAKAFAGYANDCVVTRDRRTVKPILDGAAEAALTDNRPETWFHLIGGNASKEGLVADLAAVAEAGISGITLFHGGGDGSEVWPGVTNPVPCMSAQWVDLIRFAEQECHRRGLRFKMQNCPGWSMSGGPWITPERAMRRLVCFEPGKKPAFDADDDYREIGTVEFPVEAEDPAVVRSVTVPPPSKLNYIWCFELGAVFEIWSKGRCVWTQDCPTGTWADTWGGPGLEMTFDVGALPREGLEFRTRSPHEIQRFEPVWSPARQLDNWQAKVGRTLRRLEMSTDTTPVQAVGTKKLVFGHVNMKRKNHPAPKEATGWECDKMDPRGFEANFAGYVGKLLAAGVKVDGLLVDSWECGTQTWTWKMEEEFRRRAGYELRPWLPALFGHVLESEAATEKFLLDWRNVCSRLVEENYYGTIARLAKAHGMSVHYETAFGDVLAGDILRFWKYADAPMCEFWNPHLNQGFVGSFDYKPILPCASAAHVYRKRRVSAEALTSFDLTFDENFRDWKKVIDEHYTRGVTHIVYNTFTHNPVIGGKPPSSSYGDNIGSPFLREQTWWPYLKHFSKYVERCGRELERGVPAIDILMYLGDDVNHKPSESALLFGGRYKYDYLNPEVLMNAVEVADGRLTIGALPDCPPQVGSASYRVLWVPKGTYLLPTTKARLEALSARGARIVYGDFEPDWPSPVAERLGLDPSELVGWYQRRDGDEDVFFVVEKGGRSAFYRVKDETCTVFDPVTGSECGVAAWRQPSASGGRVAEVVLKPLEDYPARATKRVYMGEVIVKDAGRKAILDLGRVRDWATVFVNGRKAGDLWCEPYACDIAPFVDADGKADVRVEVVSTWYNALAEDARLPAAQRQTWTKYGPKAGAPYHEAGLLGPVRLTVK